MRPRDQHLAQQLDCGLRSYSQRPHVLLGIRAERNRHALIEQLLESVHRVQYITVISGRNISPLRADPSSSFFDPLKGAILQKRRGEIDESFWLVFLSVHFGKHLRTGWRRCRDIYGNLGQSPIWTWARVSANPAAFRRWLGVNQNNIGGHFGNHRKYESLSAESARGTGAVVESYVRWVRPPRTHKMLIEEAYEKSDKASKATFENIYQSMKDVMSFGRMAKFDYLTMIGKLGLASIEPGIPYLQGATGPVRGARLLFGGQIDANFSAQQLDASLAELGEVLGVGMQVLEDALCNWQKSPSRFIPFRG